MPAPGQSRSLQTQPRCAGPRRLARKHRKAASRCRKTSGLRLLAQPRAGVIGSRLRTARPGPRVVGVLGRQGGRAEMEGTAGVDHDSELIGARLTDRSRDTAGRRTVGETRWGQADRAEPDACALARHEVATDVEEHLVGVDVGVVVRHGDRLRVEVEWSRAERADAEIWAFECLVGRWRHVESADARLVVVDRKAERAEAARPPPDIERTVAVA